MPQSGDQIIIRNFDLMKSDKKIDLMIAETFNLLFQSHEIRPHDHFPKFHFVETLDRMYLWCTWGGSGLRVMMGVGYLCLFFHTNILLLQ